MVLSKKNQNEENEKHDNEVEVIEDRKEHDTSFKSKTDEDEVQIIEDCKEIANEVIEIENSDKELDDTQKSDGLGDFNGSIGEELDDQITDLLTSIQKEEEKIQETVEADDNKLETIHEVPDDTQQEVNIDSSKINIGEPEKVNEVTESANKDSTQQNAENETGSNKDILGTLKCETNTSGTVTPTRSSARLANTTPSTIRTRRASRLMQNN